VYIDNQQDGDQRRKHRAPAAENYQTRGEKKKGRKDRKTGEKSPKRRNPGKRRPRPKQRETGQTTGRKGPNSGPKKRAADKPPLKKIKNEPLTQERKGETHALC
jgi:hypothetical protein